MVRVRVGVAVVVLSLAASMLPATAAIAKGDGDWASMSFYEELEEGPSGVGLRFFSWGTSYSDGVPPAETGGLGDAGVCLGVTVSTDGRFVLLNGCIQEGNWTLDSLGAATIDDSIVMEVRNDEDQVIGSETLDIEVSLTGQGPVYPGVSGSATPSPGAEVEWTLMRAATAQGTLSSPLIGVMNVTGRPATLARHECVGYLTGYDPAETCRSNT